MALTQIRQIAATRMLTWLIKVEDSPRVVPENVVSGVWTHATVAVTATRDGQLVLSILTPHCTQRSSR